MKNKQNYANSKQNIVFTTAFCESGEIGKREMISMTAIWISSFVLDSDTFRKLDLSRYFEKMFLFR
jgi:hypothetical protein